MKYFLGLSGSGIAEIARFNPVVLIIESIRSPSCIGRPPVHYWIGLLVKTPTLQRKGRGILTIFRARNSCRATMISRNSAVIAFFLPPEAHLIPATSVACHRIVSHSRGIVC
ncbi:unnamed protein product [Pylaiella littoralis]